MAHRVQVTMWVQLSPVAGCRSRSNVGIESEYAALAVVIVVTLLPVLGYKEPTSKHRKLARAASNSQKYANPFMDIVNFLRRPGIGSWLAILALYTTGPYMASRMFRPLLVDIGLSLGDIGLMLGMTRRTQLTPEID